MGLLPQRFGFLRNGAQRRNHELPIRCPWQPTVVTNHLGHADVYTYDLGGRVLSHTSPTGLVTAYTYDVSGNVLSIRRESQLTSFTYRASGELASVTLPHGHSITYAYDNAHRLIGWADNRGASANYVLDGMGNRVTEEVRARDGQLAWRLVRSINEINRVASLSTDAVPQTSKFTYDNNGDVTRIANGKNEGTSYGLDSLRRVKTLSNAAGAAASIAYNALDDVTQASDFKGVATAYTRDALGNATTEASPDSGLRGGQYDALGLPTKVTDALGQATTIERDLLGRPTRITHASGPATTLRYDVTPTNKGYLGEIVDASGTTTYQRDAYGRVISKTQVLINGDTRSISYGYNAQGLLASTTYPGGQVLQNVYDATGQLIAMNWAGQPLVTGITWTPLGQPASWSWSLAGGASPVPAMRSYNTAGQLTATEFSSYQYDAAGRITGLTQSVWQPASSNPQDNSTIQGSKAWTVKYDLAGRITQFEDAGRSTTYSYDANGNRRSSVQTTKQGTPGTLSRTYSGDTSHNRLLGFTQSTTAPGSTSNTSVTYQYNAAGDLLSDGLRAYGYDSQGRMESATTGQGADAPQTKYAHNGLGQRVFKTEPLYSSAAAKPA
ncbi:MAG: RHS repeat protein, partial [Acidovorax sp.]